MNRISKIEKELSGTIRSVNYRDLNTRQIGQCSAPNPPTRELMTPNPTINPTDAAFLAALLMPRDLGSTPRTGGADCEVTGTLATGGL